MYVEIAWSGDPNKSNDGRVVSELRGCSSDEGDGTKQSSTFSAYCKRAYALAPKQANSQSSDIREGEIALRWVNGVQHVPFRVYQKDHNEEWPN